MAVILMSGFNCPENMEIAPSGHTLHISKVTGDIARSLIRSSHEMGCLLNTLPETATQEIEDMFDQEIQLHRQQEVRHLGETDIAMVRSTVNRERWWLIGYVPERI